MLKSVSCTKCFGSLGVDSRMKIYKFLKDKGKSTVSSVVKYVGLTQPTVSYHLKGMRDAGLLESYKAGKEVFYSIKSGCEANKAGCVLSNFNFSGK